MPLRPLVAALLIATCTSTAAFFSLPQTVTARVIDEASGKPLAPVYAVATEAYSAPAIGHGSIHRCVRFGVGAGSTPEGAHIALPLASRQGFSGLSGGGTTALRALADLLEKFPPRKEFVPVCAVEGSLPFWFESPR